MIKDPAFKQLILKMKLFISIAFSIFAWVQSEPRSANLKYQTDDCGGFYFVKRNSVSPCCRETGGLMVKPLQRPICPSSSGPSAEQDLTEEHLRTMDVKLMTLAAALMVLLHAPPSQGMQL